jgi:taurine dioxygenase
MTTLDLSPTTTDESPLAIRRVAGRIGAEISGVDLAADLDDSTIAAIRTALLRHKVVFFRDQHDLDANGHARFAARFGPLTTAHPTVPAHPDHPHVLDLDYSRSASRANVWHTDVTFVDRPPLGSVLRAVTIPEYGGDTVWANTVAAYELLPEHLRLLADHLRVVHTNAFDYAALSQRSDAYKQYAAVFASTVFETEHPVVRVHPETGERSLLLGGFARQLRGLGAAESADLLRIFHAAVTSLENTVRWQWREGDVAFWDNRSTQHYAIADYGDQPRHLQRITIAGDLPVGVDGRVSESVQGDSSAYTPEAA